MANSVKFHANGKLLITGEYLVLDHALALALPLCFGQTMHLEPIPEPVIRWKSTGPAGTWLEGDLDIENLEVINDPIQDSDSQAKLNYVCMLLKTARSLSPGFLHSEFRIPKSQFGVPNLEFGVGSSELGGISVEIHANYPLEWGLGSSSTLISLIAQWAGVDGFRLFREVSKGSGYDVVSATQTSAFYYRLKPVENSNLNEFPYEVLPVAVGNAIRNYAYFGYLGNKQDSSTEVKNYLRQAKTNPEMVQKISDLTKLICQAENLDELIQYVNAHERILAEIIRKQTIGHERFNNLPFAVKSLGAWGGDFAMFVSGLGFEETKSILESRGVTPLFSYQNICYQA
jgi:mevalonate kinase